MPKPLTKLSTQLTHGQVSYSLWDTALTPGQTVVITDTGQRQCGVCGKATHRLMDGSCPRCFMTSPWHSPCIIRPELCEGHLGKGRDPVWEAQHHHQPHVAYLALSGGIKVGVTRFTQVPTRWMDQGATEACVLAVFPNRYLAGVMECLLKTILSDRTSWQKMLKGVPVNESLAGQYQAVWEWLDDTWKPYQHPFNPTSLLYPVIQFPHKIQSLKLNGEGDQITGKLMGIKGQYLILDGGRVFNVRRYAGVVCEGHFGGI